MTPEISSYITIPFYFRTLRDPLYQGDKKQEYESRSTGRE